MFQAGSCQHATHSKPPNHLSLPRHVDNCLQVALVGKQRLVLDLSCRQRDGQYWVVTDRWQRFSSLALSEATLAKLADSCDEFLVHGVDVEGMQLGIDDALVELLGRWSPIPVTYAGGARTLVSCWMGISKCACVLQCMQRLQCITKSALGKHNQVGSRGVAFSVDGSFWQQSEAVARKALHRLLMHASACALAAGGPGASCCCRRGQGGYHSRECAGHLWGQAAVRRRSSMAQQAADGCCMRTGAVQLLLMVSLLLKQSQSE